MLTRVKLKHVWTPRSSKSWQTSTPFFCWFRWILLHSRYRKRGSAPHSPTSERSRHSKFESIFDRDGSVNQGEVARKFAAVPEGVKHHITESLRDASACITP